MSRAGRVLAVDYGTRRVGVAIADPLGLFAQPFGTFTPARAVEALVGVQEREGIDVIVIGWPLLEDGSEGMATRRVQEYINRLRRRLPKARIVQWDEGFTSEEAKDRLRGRMRSRDRGRVDQAAAGIILQEYLEAARETSGAA